MGHAAGAVMLVEAIALGAIARRWPRVVPAGLLLLTASALLLRDAALWTHPRLWAEEGSVYLQFAWTHPWWQALAAPHMGYYALFANVGSLLAAAAPIEAAAWVTTALSATLPLATAGLIAASSAPGLRTTAQKILAGVAAIVVGASGELWLNTINAQHWMPLIVFLILIDDKETRRKRACFYALTVFCGLSSVAANFLAPLFLLRWLRERRSADRTLFFLLAATAAVQLAVIAYSALALGDSAYAFAQQARFCSTRATCAPLASALWEYGVRYPLFGWFHGFHRIAPLVLLAIVALGWGALRQLSLYWLAIALVTVLSQAGSLGMEGGSRYEFAPAVVLSLALLRLGCEPHLPRLRRAGVLAVGFAACGAWLIAFDPGIRPFHEPAWPDWQDEVARWKADPAHAPLVHPQWAQQPSATLWRVQPPPDRL